MNEKWREKNQVKEAVEHNTAKLDETLTKVKIIIVISIIMLS